MSSVQNGLAFFEILKSKDGGFNEYIPANGFLGEYVDKLEQQSSGSGATNVGESSLEQPITPTPKGNVPRWKRRTSQQIEANKAAQKRYREKKKAKLEEDSAKVSTLKRQTEDFAALEGEVRSKERENLDLEAQLFALEAELQQIRIELDGKTPQGKFQAQKPQNTFSCLGPSSLDAKTEQISTRWRKAKEKLDAVLEKSNLRPNENPTVSSSIERKLEKQCLAAVQQCMLMMTVGGPALDDLLRTLPGGNEDLMRDSSMDEYKALVQFLNLSSNQIESISQLLPNVLQRLERIYKARQELNARVLSLLVAPDASASSEGSSNQAADLRKALDQLQDNLTEEQRLESEHHYAVLREILTNLQGAWFISKTYPKHCDTLAFMQAVKRLSQQEP